MAQPIYNKALMITPKPYIVNLISLQGMVYDAPSIVSP